MRGALAKRALYGRVALHARALEPGSRHHIWHGGRYRRATDGSSHSDEYPNGSALYTGGVSSTLQLCSEPLLHIAPYGPSFESVRNAASFSFISWACAFRAEDDAFIFSVGPLGSRRGVKSGDWLSGLALLGYDGASSPWRRRLCIVTALALNRSAYRRLGKG
jgi:hypothetical protein